MKLYDGEVIFKPNLSTTQSNYLNFLMSHHRYSAKDFKKAEGTALGECIDKVILYERSCDFPNSRC